jgi:hypothetical protein
MPARLVRLHFSERERVAETVQEVRGLDLRIDRERSATIRLGSRGCKPSTVPRSERNSADSAPVNWSSCSIGVGRPVRSGIAAWERVPQRHRWAESWPCSLRA